MSFLQILHSPLKQAIRKMCYGCCFFAVRYKRKMRTLFYYIPWSSDVSESGQIPLYLRPSKLTAYFYSLIVRPTIKEVKLYSKVCSEAFIGVVHWPDAVEVEAAFWREQLGVLGAALACAQCLSQPNLAALFSPCATQTDQALSNILCGVGCSRPGHSGHRITEPQNSWGWQGPLELVWFKPCSSRATHSRLPRPSPGCFWRSPRGIS